jgi:histidyl-tRNA synthetase
MQSTEPYKGVRDFYPEDKFYLWYILDTFAKTAQSFGYEEYDASILEPAEMYKGKTSEEIINEQAYTFVDRGGREVILRPEMTPTVARLVAGRRRELGYPLRLFSNPNCFRYEKPQRGRLREFWQFNADMFGMSGVEADAEIVALGYRCLMAFGASADMFTIQINSREVINEMLDKYAVPAENRSALLGVIDRKAKMPEGEYLEKIQKLVPSQQGSECVQSALNFLNEYENIAQHPSFTALLTLLAAQGITNVVVDPYMVRGFQYYTGFVMECVDTDPANRRALFGGGRYDQLLTLFGAEPVPTVGFAIGDVTARDFLETHNLLPKYTPATRAMICYEGVEKSARAQQLATDLRAAGMNIAVNATGKKLGDQFKSAEKLSIPFCIVVEESGFTVKNVATRESAGAATSQDCVSLLQ